MGDDVVQGVVAAASRETNGFRIEKTWYDNKSGLPLPEKGAEITAVVRNGKEVVYWERGRKELGDWRKKIPAATAAPAPKARAPSNDAGGVKDAVGVFLECYEQVGGTPWFSQLSEEEKRITAAVIYREVMEDRRSNQQSEIEAPRRDESRGLRSHLWLLKWYVVGAALVLWAVSAL